MFSCASCGEQHTDGPVCSVCKRQYDFQCSGVTETGYRRLGDRKNTWRCPKCKSCLSPTPAAVSPQPSQLDKIQEQLNNITFKLGPLSSLADDMKSIKCDLNDLKESLEMAHQQIHDFKGLINGLENRISNVEKVVVEIPSLRSEVASLKLELHERDQFARANNVEIRGIPLRKNENLYDIAEKICSFTKTAFKKEDLNYIARIPTRVPNADKPIVLSFNNRYKKEELISAARKLELKLSDIGYKDVAGRFYLNDHLTQQNKILLNKAKSLAKANNFRYIWVKHGKIMAKKSDASRFFYIKSENDLALII